MLAHTITLLFIVVLHTSWQSVKDTSKQARIVLWKSGTFFLFFVLLLRT